MQQGLQHRGLKAFANDDFAIRQRQSQQSHAVLGVALFLRMLKHQDLGAVGCGLRQCA